MSLLKKKPKPKDEGGVQYQNKSGVFTLKNGKLIDADGNKTNAAAEAKKGGQLKRVKLEGEANA